MPKLVLTSKNAFYLFIALGITLVAMGVWWITLMATIIDEKVELAEELGASQELIQQIHDEEISRQMMVGTEGIFFLLLIGVGCWLIYRALVRNEQLKFYQQNFLMAVTHELKTPLASMSIYLDTLKSEKIKPEKKIEINPKIKDDLGRLEKLVENILDAGRFERRGYELQRETFDISSLFRLAVQKLSAYKLKRPIKIHAEKIQPEIMFYGDPNSLNRAFDAILENSLKYNESDEYIITVEMSVHERNLTIRIKDNGIGIEKEELNKIFQRFYRSGNELNRSKPGSGLGLYLAHEIIKAHDGTIQVHSDGPGTGAEFVIQLLMET